MSYNLAKPGTNPATHGPGGKPHPQCVLNYLAAYRVAVPDGEAPHVWDRGNGWLSMQWGCHSRPQSLRRNQLEGMTERLKARVTT